VAYEPSETFLTDGPSAALPVTGGSSCQTVENISFKVGGSEILSVGRATASVTGARRENHYVSVATSRIENLNILGIVTADVIVSRVTSVYPPPESVRRRHHRDCDSSQFLVMGSHFDNLRINGQPQEYSIDPVEAEEGFMLKPTETTVGPISRAQPGKIFVPELGTIHLGEKVTYGAKLILTMLRADLHHGHHRGHFPIATCCTNGSPGLKGGPGH